MFSPGGDSERSNSTGGGTVLIPTRFVWPYGGRRVYLSGSFTRWGNWKFDMLFQCSSEWPRLVRLMQMAFWVFWILLSKFVIMDCLTCRWTDHILMSPMEGCPTVFQVIYNLAPGYHQVSIPYPCRDASSCSFMEDVSKFCHCQFKLIFMLPVVLLNMISISNN